MAPRLALALAAPLVLVIAACASTPPAPTATPVALRPVAQAPAPTPVPLPSMSFEPAPSLPDEGNVDGLVYPGLTIEEPDANTLRVRLDDPSAKAWRVVVAGTGDLAEDRFEIEVETGDVAPAITATEVRNGQSVSEMDLSGFFDGTAAAGGCHGTLAVCLDSDGFRLPRNGDGRFALRLSVADAQGPLTITGSTAGWPGEPFVLGPWVATEPFTWTRS